MDVIPPSPYERMKPLRENALKRLKTFKYWQSYVNPVPLALKGFYYTGLDDKVQCTHCGGILSDWKREDDPDEVHERHFPDCPSINGMTKLSRRLSTFKNWLKRHVIDPLSLAKAGFYYLGKADKVECFYCHCFVYD
ncbi:hypothetical protein KUTeg_011239 [Tegillarca granosa]|uniref:Uncharacterized protein n=1 Tax=Tegillarca granosa TaxID=220873 RepID=A0ABQ9F1E6_TEGGR|nr:hypothetical protein KUTeg_011239 [Tegillarca granosa]